MHHFYSLRDINMYNLNYIRLKFVDNYLNWVFGLTDCVRTQRHYIETIGMNEHKPTQHTVNRYISGKLSAHSNALGRLVLSFPSGFSHT